MRGSWTSLENNCYTKALYKGDPSREQEWRRQRGLRPAAPSAPASSCTLCPASRHAQLPGRCCLLVTTSWSSDGRRGTCQGLAWALLGHRGPTHTVWFSVGTERGLHVILRGLIVPRPTGCWVVSGDTPGPVSQELPACPPPAFHHPPYSSTRRNHCGLSFFVTCSGVWL